MISFYENQLTLLELNVKAVENAPIEVNILTLEFIKTIDVANYPEDLQEKAEKVLQELKETLSLRIRRLQQGG